MILTGKALEDFLQFHNQPKVWYDLIIKSESYTILYGLIIEWLDSVGISLEIGTCPNGFTEDEKPIYYYDWQIYAVYNCCSSDEEFDNRQEATRQAIIKANEIYNFIILNEPNRTA